VAFIVTNNTIVLKNRKVPNVVADAVVVAVPNAGAVESAVPKPKPAKTNANDSIFCTRKLTLRLIMP